MLRLVKQGSTAEALSSSRLGDDLRDEIQSVARAARAGDARAIRTLLSSTGPGMLGAIRKVLGRSAIDPSDVLQDAMVGLIKGLHAFREECSVPHFARRVAVMTALSARRRQRNRTNFEVGSSLCEVEQSAVGAGDPESEVEATARRLVLWKLLDELAPAQAECLALHCVEGFTVEEVAAASGAPIETVKSRLRLAKATLRARIEQDERARDLCWREP